MKNILFIVILFLCGNSFSQTKNKSGKEEHSKPEEEIYTIVDEMPEFPGGQTAMMKYIRDNLKFPESAKNDTQFKNCKTFIQFIVTVEGKIKDETVVRNCIGCSDCDVAAIKVISGMPLWKPGKQNGKVVAVNYALPIFFDNNK